MAGPTRQRPGANTPGTVQDRHRIVQVSPEATGTVRQDADPDLAWQLGALRGEITSDHATTWVANVRDLLTDPAMVDARDEGDRRWPRDGADTRRYATPEAPPEVDEDPATAADIEELVAHRANGAGEHTDGVVDGELILDEVAMFLGRFVAFPSPAAQTAVALWVAHTHMVHVFESTPRLAVLSPEPGSGKSRSLEVIELLAPRPQHLLNASTAAVFRMIEQARPTLLLDEVDAIFGRSGKGDDSTEDLRALLNAGHRRSATIPRCVGPTHQVQHFPVYAACALAGLGDLPDTLMSRSVVVRMRRRAPHEHVDSFRRRLAEPEGHRLRDALAAWAETVADECGEPWPAMPEGVTDRPADVWEPLLAVADAAGGHWPRIAREACSALVASGTTAEGSLGVRLLGDLRDVFDGDDRLSTVTVIERLVALDEAPWGDWYGKPIDARWLARKLKPYGIGSTKIRFGASTARGYDAGHFRDAWDRYLPPPQRDGTTGTGGTPQVTSTRDVPPVPHVPLFQGEDGEADR